MTICEKTDDSQQASGPTEKNTRNFAFDHEHTPSPTRQLIKWLTDDTTEMTKVVIFECVCAPVNPLDAIVLAVVSQSSDCHTKDCDKVTHSFVMCAIAHPIEGYAQWYIFATEWDPVLVCKTATITTLKKLHTLKSQHEVARFDGKSYYFSYFIFFRNCLLAFSFPFDTHFSLTYCSANSIEI